jgi:DNA-nicking Smr family endonuclease
MRSAGCANAARTGPRARAERERLRGRARARRGRAVPRRSAGRAAQATAGSIHPASPPPHPRQRELDERAAQAASLSDEIGIEQLLDTDEELSFRRENVGPDVLPRLRRGHWVVQNQLDLHGLRVDEAREALVAFIARALKREQRCLRVIHGKGLGSAGKEPVLKGKVLKWLVQRDEVLAFCQARPTDGGAGALIVLLRPAARSAAARPPRR